ncbi:MAG: class III signal peptide-containing protein [Candidatus Diapherotrites archaeon]
MQKAQGALEYLLLIGGAVLVAVIVITLILSIAGTGETQVTTSATTAFDKIREAAGGGTASFFDNFSDGDYTSNPVWTTTGSNIIWSVTGGKFRHAATADGWKFAQDLTGSYGDHTFEFDFTPVSGTSYMGAVYRNSNTSGSTNSMLLYRYYAWNYWRLYDWSTGQIVDLTDPITGAAWVNGTTYRIKLVVIGQNVKLYVNGVYAGEDNFTGHATGGIGLLSYGAQTIDYDNVKVTET